MPPVTRAQWVTRLKEAGVTVPDSWTLIQIKAHWAEMQDNVVGDFNWQMQGDLSGLRRAAGKKADLRQWLEKEDIKVPETSTIAHMMAAGEKAIHGRYEPCGMDLVGFGIHAAEKLQDVIFEHEEYVQWCEKTIAETDSPYWRMQRLVAYYHKAKKIGATGVRGGYPSSRPPTKAAPPSLTKGAAAVSDDSSWEGVSEVKSEKLTGSIMDKVQEQIRALQLAQHELQAENAELKMANQSLRVELAESERVHGRSKERRET